MHFLYKHYYCVSVVYFKGKVKHTPGRTTPSDRSFDDRIISDRTYDRTSADRTSDRRAPTKKDNLSALLQDELDLLNDEMSSLGRKKTTNRERKKFTMENKNVHDLFGKHNQAEEEMDEGVSFGGNLNMDSSYGRLNMDTSYDKTEVEVDKTKPTEDWNYQKIRDLLSQLNTGIFWYADKLTKNVLRGKVFQTKFFDCNTKFKRLLSEYKGTVHDKIKLQEQLDDLQAKYNALEQVLEKVKDLNEDNRQTIDKLRANRDRCLQAGNHKMKTIDSLRNQAAELRRKLSHFRGQH